MSANINTYGSTKKIAMVVASPAVSTTVGGPVGFWASELTHAWYELAEVGYSLDLFSPKGGKVELDELSDPRHPSGYSAHDLISMGFLNTPKLASLLDNTRKHSEIRVADYTAIYVAGGQAPMFTFREDRVLQGLLRDFYEAGKVSCVVCHGTAALLDTKLSNGNWLIEGRHMTGFADSEEDFADAYMKTKVMPFRIQQEATRTRGANFSVAPAFRPFAVRDGNLITGQQQYSAREAVRLVLEALGH